MKTGLTAGGGIQMGDEPWLIMPMGINSYKTHPYEIKSILYDLITRTRAFASSLSCLGKIAISSHFVQMRVTSKNDFEQYFFF